MAVSSYAQKRAKELLGNLDLGSFEKQRSAAKGQYNADLGSLTSEYNNLKNDISKTKQESRQDFSSARSTIAENAFDKARSNYNNLASRNLINSGLVDLGKVGERMETGRQVSDVANKYYRALSDLVTQENQAGTNYTQGRSKLGANLNSMLANVGSSEYQAKANYNQGIASLAMQIQSQMDQQAAAAAARARAAAAAKADKQKLTMLQQIAQNEKGFTLIEDFKKKVAANPSGSALPLMNQYAQTLKSIGAGDMIGQLSNAYAEASQAYRTQSANDRTAAYANIPIEKTRLTGINGGGGAF